MKHTQMQQDGMFFKYTSKLRCIRAWVRVRTRGSTFGMREYNSYIEFRSRQDGMCHSLRHYFFGMARLVRHPTR